MSNKDSAKDVKLPIGFRPDQIQFLEDFVHDAKSAKWRQASKASVVRAAVDAFIKMRINPKTTTSEAHLKERGLAKLGTKPKKPRKGCAKPRPTRTK